MTPVKVAGKAEPIEAESDSRDDRPELDEIDPYYERHLAAEIAAQLPYNAASASRVLRYVSEILALA
jgi:hypothetical protein